MELPQDQGSQRGAGTVPYRLTFVYSQQTAWAGIAQSEQRIATGWMVRGSNPGGDTFFRNR